MAEATLRDRRILVVEDEFLLAETIRGTLEDAGAIVLGPAGTVEAAVAIIRAEPQIDGAIVDVNVRGTMAFPAADLLIARGVPFLFTTGYAQAMIPDRYAAIARCDKPVDGSRLTRALGRAMGG